MTSKMKNIGDSFENTLHWTKDKTIMVVCQNKKFNDRHAFPRDNAELEVKFPHFPHSFLMHVSEFLQITAKFVILSPTLIIQIHRNNFGQYFIIDINANGSPYTASFYVNLFNTFFCWKICYYINAWMKSS